ncbi:MAG: hypothetical protein NW220_20810 [Leptolyngbyaceae cyanobacterium bins.349]|nr:hypothetical protein [Leptolyngbyaceae cyanobacterium bins.349]
MQSKPQDSAQGSAQVPEFAEPVVRKPLVLLRDTERSLRVRTVTAIAPLLPERAAINLGEASLVADESMEELAEIDLEDITDEDLRPARLQMGMLFVGFGALATTFLLMVLYLLHPEMTVAEQVYHHWHQYVWFVCLGISGLFMVGREAMRPVELPEERQTWQDAHRDEVRNRRGGFRGR